MRRMFTEKQVKEMALDTDFSSKDLSVKTLSIQEPNYTRDIKTEIESAFASQTALSGCNLTISYAKLIMFANILYLVISLKIDNVTESSISAGSFGPQIDVSEIADKIVDQNGTPLSEPTDANTRIAGLVEILSRNRAGSHNMQASSIYRGTAANILRISLDYLSMNAGQSSYLDTRDYLIIL